MRKKTLTLILALCMTVTAMVSFTAGAAASGGLQAISAYLNRDITITLDGETQVLKDASGARIYPITYNGSTYLPVRAVAGMAGLDVDWDQATKTVVLGQIKGVDLIDTYKAYHFGGESPWSWAGQSQTADGKPEDISGITCSHWVDLCTATVGNGDASVSFNLAGKHDTLTFIYYSNNNATLKVLGDNGSVLFEKAVTGGQVAQTVTIPLFKTSELTFEASMPDWDTRLWIFNAYLDAE